MLCWPILIVNIIIKIGNAQKFPNTLQAELKKRILQSQQPWVSPLGDGGMQPPVRNSGDVPPKIVIFKENWMFTRILDLPIFPKKGAKSDDKSEFRGKWFSLTWIHPSQSESVSYVESSWQCPCQQYKPQIMWCPCWIATNSTSTVAMC